MKKRAIIIVLIWCLFVGLVWPYRKKADALGDPLTAGMLSGVSFALFTDWGITTTFSAGTNTFSQDFMTNAIQNFVNSQGGDIASIFGSEAAKIVAGKLVVGQQLYNGIVEFAHWIKDAYNISSIPEKVGYDGHISDPVPNEEAQNVDYAYGTTGYVVQEYIEPNIHWVAYVKDVYGNSYRTVSGRINSYQNVTGPTVSLYNSSRPWKVQYTWRVTGTGGSLFINAPQVECATFSSYTEMSLSPDYVEPTVLNPDKEWSGTIGGQDWPDTNMDQLIGSIFDGAADNNLDVDGEIIDVPVPPGPIPTWTPVDDVIDGINGMGEILDGIGNDIGDISGHLDDIGDQIGDVTGAIEGVQEGIQSQTGAISGAIDQAAQDVVDAIGEQTAAIEDSLADTAEAAQEIAEALQPGEIEPKKFDLRRLFPFCIPFDIHNLLQKFNATPVAPHVQLPFVIQSLGFSYIFDLDFSAFDSVAQVMRTVEFIVFAIGLAWATSKVIKW